MMKKRMMAFGAMALIVVSAEAAWKDPVQAVGAESRVFTGADGAAVRVDTVAPDIFRVRVRRGETWSESPMNRYSIFARPVEAASGAPRGST